MLHKLNNPGTRKVSPPQPTNMTTDQKRTYLASLRQNRPSRPVGARPPPERSSTTNNRVEHDMIKPEPTIETTLRGNNDPKRHLTGPSPNSMPPVNSFKGRPLVQAPSELPPVRKQSDSMQPGALRYHESKSREMEKREAHSLRQALEKIDHADDEARIYTAAQNEAADLVWKHLNPQLADLEKTAAYRNPDLVQSQTKKGGHTVQFEHTTRADYQRPLPTEQPISSNYGIPELRPMKRGSRADSNPRQVSLNSERRRSSGKRVQSNGSGKSVFRNPEDQIYEEPDRIVPALEHSREPQELPLQIKPQNSLLRGSRPLPEKTQSAPLPVRARFNPFDIHRNPPSQSRKAGYTSNPPSREATPEIEALQNQGKEIRSEEIRAATSMKRKDRSSNLPTPTAVSDNLGRPIVSFDPAWRAESRSPRPSLDMDKGSIKGNTKASPSPLDRTQSVPAIPTICLPDNDNVDMPSIHLPEDNTVPEICVSSAPEPPSINTQDQGKENFSTGVTNGPQIVFARPLPQPKDESRDQPRPRPLPTHNQSLPGKLPPTTRLRNDRVPWLSRGPANNVSQVSCNACQLPIAGRIVTASGSKQDGPKVRFHPECFACHHCSTALECVSFYPEPETAREARLLNEQQNDDGTVDASEMRFYCHLDFHDLFSPRCANCRTPIEGAVVLAVGKSWHEDHFFCAECGDPFSSSSPFVEDKGYAYCVSCHTRRTSARCRKCKKQILEEVSVEALGGKWHEECFCCDECGGAFDEDGRFFVREVEVELTEKEKRKGMGQKFEDRAVCHRCEELRLRRVDAFI